MKLTAIAAVVTVLIGVGWWAWRQSGQARRNAILQTGRELTEKYRNQPERMLSYWRRQLDNTNPELRLETESHAAIQELIDTYKLEVRIDALYAQSIRNGDKALMTAVDYARVSAWLCKQFKTKRPQAEAESRLKEIEELQKYYKDALNLIRARTRYELAIANMLKMYKRRPEMEFLRPKIVALQITLGNAYMLGDQLEKAEQETAVALAAMPDPKLKAQLEMIRKTIKERDPLPLLEKGQRAEKDSRWSEALDAYNKAYTLRPSNKEVKAGYGRVLKFYARIFLNEARKGGVVSNQSQRFIEMAQEHASVLAEINDQDLMMAETLYLLARFSFDRGQTKEANDQLQGAFRQLMGIRGTSADKAMLLAKVFRLIYKLALQQGQEEEAERMLQKAELHCREAMSKGHKEANALFLEIRNTQRMMEAAKTRHQTDESMAPQRDDKPEDPRGVVKDGPLGGLGPVDVRERK